MALGGGVVTGGRRVAAAGGGRPFVLAQLAPSN